MKHNIEFQRFFIILLTLLYMSHFWTAFYLLKIKDPSYIILSRITLENKYEVQNITYFKKQVDRKCEL